MPGPDATPVPPRLNGEAPGGTAPNEAPQLLNPRDQVAVSTRSLRVGLHGHHVAESGNAPDRFRAASIGCGPESGAQWDESGWRSLSP